MRIAMFSDSYYPYISGVTRAIAVARETLAAMGHEVPIFCPRYPDALPEEDVYRLPSFRAPTTNAGYYVALPFLTRLERRVSSLNPDVIHIHSPFNLGRSGYSIGRRLGIPVVFTYHTMYGMYSHYVPLLGKSVSGIVEGLAIKVASSVDAVITPSGVIAGYLRDRGVRRPVFPIPNGIDVSQFQGGDRAFLRERLGIRGGVPIVLTCGRLAAEKNVDTVLRSFALTAKETDAALVLVGDGPLKGRLQEIARSLGISGRTHFAGAFPPAEMPHVYAGADLFLFASLTDTQGLVVVEAKAAGLPAVAVGALGVKDMVRDGEDGYLCPDDAAELSRKTVELLCDPALISTMREAASRNAFQFSREASASKLVGCYRSVTA